MRILEVLNSWWIWWIWIIWWIRTGGGNGNDKNPNIPNAFLRIGGPLILFEYGTHWSKWDLFLFEGKSLRQWERESTGFNLNTGQQQLFHEQWTCWKFKCFTKTIPPHHCKVLRLLKKEKEKNYCHDGFWNIFHNSEDVNLSNSGWPIKVERVLDFLLSTKTFLSRIDQLGFKAGMAFICVFEKKISFGREKRLLNFPPCEHLHLCVWEQYISHERKNIFITRKKYIFLTREKIPDLDYYISPPASTGLGWQGHHLGEKNKTLPLW